MKMRRKLLGGLLILVGLMMLATPTLKTYYYEKQQQTILNAWLDNMALMDAMPEEDDALAVFDGGDPSQASIDLEKRSEEERRLAEKRQKYIVSHMEGILHIPKIELKLPILIGVNEKNLNISVASIVETGKVGSIGNYCIAGHRSRTYGRQFNRLDELTAGDVIEVITEDTLYQYEVLEKVIVQPDDTWVLQSDESKRITLITCDYSAKPSLRLIVSGQLIEAA
jgi:sortase A